MSRLYNKLNNIVPEKEHINEATPDIHRELLITIVDTLDGMNIKLSKGQQRMFIVALEQKLKLLKI